MLLEVAQILVVIPFKIQDRSRWRHVVVSFCSYICGSCQPCIKLAGLRQLPEPVHENRLKGRLAALLFAEKAKLHPGWRLGKEESASINYSWRADRCLFHGLGRDTGHLRCTSHQTWSPMNTPTVSTPDHESRTWLDPTYCTASME